jgi:hypothetical protein
MPVPPPRYITATRAPRYAVCFALPLLLAYEALLAVRGASGSNVRNGADVLLTSAFSAVAGQHGPVIFGALLVSVGAWLAWRDRQGGLKAGWLAAMFAESVVLAGATALVVGTLTAQLLGRAALLAIAAGPLEALPVADRLTLSLGAGLYEELLFRVLLVPALAWGARSLLGVGATAASVVAVMGSALVFSAFHYVGPSGDAFTLVSFAFRAIAGVWFSTLYVVRGFGIAAWTHALYDIGVLVL